MNKENSNKYLLLGGAVVIAAVLFFGLKFELPGVKTAGTSGQKISIPPNSANLKIFLKNGQIRMFQGQVNPNASLLNVLYFVSLKGVDLKYSIDKKGTFNLLSFAGVISGGPKSWHFYVNGKETKTADLNKVIIKGGDLIEAKLE